MSTSENFQATRNAIILNYLPPEFHSGKEIYIDYYVFNPGKNKLDRKKIKLNRVKNKLSPAEFKRYWKGVIKNLSEKLASGWNPFIEQEAAKGFTTLEAALSTYLDAKIKELEPNSLKSFKSFINMLLEFCEKQIKQPDILVINFTKHLAKEYLNYKWLECNVSGKTYNNYILGYHAIWSWLVEFHYSKINVFDDISRKKVKGKTRIEIDSNLRLRLKRHLLDSNLSGYWLMCELCFFGLIRPSEMVKIKTENVFPDKQIIILKANETKNDDQRVSSVPQHIVPLLKAHLNSRKGKYLFSMTDNYLPGDVQLNPMRISKRWESLRSILNIPKNIQFYSQRDSGIIYLLGKIENPEFVRDQADHYSLTMTTEYSKHFRPKGIKEIQNVEPDI